MAIILPSGFNITNVDPIDARFSVADQTARLGFSAANVYEGLVVYQQDTNELYVLTNTGSYNSNTGWTIISTNTGSFATTGSNTFKGDIIVQGNLTAQQLIVSSSVYHVTQSYSSGSTIFGDSTDDTHQFTGSLYVSGSLNVLSGITSSLFGTASYATTASYIESLYSSNHTQSFSNSSTWTFNHGLDTRFVIIQTYDSNYDEMIPQNIDLTDANTATITFPTLESGYAVATVGGALANSNTYVTNIGGGDTGSFATTGSNIFIGNQTITGSITATAGITGSLQGTSSFATNALSSSYAVTASYSKNLVISGSINSVDYIDFNESAGVTVQSGQLAWNSSDGTLDLGLKGGNVTLQVGQETLYEVRNATGVTISNGTSLYASGVTAGSGRIEASPFTANGSVREIRFLGLATEDIGIGVNGYVTHFGYTRGLDTRGTSVTAISVGDENWSVGDILYAHPTAAGKLTNVKPKHEISVAIVIVRHQTTGILFVRPSSFGHLEDNHDVNINTGSLSTGDLLIYDSGSSYWINSKQLSGSYSITGSINVSGSSNFTGTQIVSGSARGNVTALSITSNTASLNLSEGNFFTLQLVEGTNTYINPSNILPGQTSILTVSTTGSATVSWPNSVKQPSGSIYIPTTTTGIDIITLASLNSSTLYVVGVKNMI